MNASIVHSDHGRNYRTNGNGISTKSKISSMYTILTKHGPNGDGTKDEAPRDTKASDGPPTPSQHYQRKPSQPPYTAETSNDQKAPNPFSHPLQLARKNGGMKSSTPPPAFNRYSKELKPEQPSGSQTAHIKRLMAPLPSSSYLTLTHKKDLLW
jgi:hypothetical protein